MLVYHGTSGPAWKQNISEIGLLPRGAAHGTWYTNVESNGSVVYITSDKRRAQFYTYRACLAADSDEDGMIITIDTERCEQDALCVDENFIDWEERGRTHNCDWDMRIAQRQKVPFDRRWRESIDRVKMASHYGKIDPYAFIRVEPEPAINIYHVPELKTIPSLKHRLLAHDWWLSYYCNDRDEAGWSHYLRVSRITQVQTLKEVFERAAIDD